MANKGIPSGIEGLLLQSNNEVAMKLMRARPEDFDRALWESLQIIGRTVHADRAYIWQNYEEDGESFCRQTHEWSEGAEPQQGNEIVSALPYKEVPFWWDCIMSGKPINSPVSKLPPEERAVLEPQGIASILVLPVMAEGRSWGFIGFDDCRNERYFAQVELQLLLSAGTLMASAIIRNLLTKDLKEQIQAARRASEASELKSSFLARTSHEIRTPMNAIIGMAELALREDLQPEVRSHILDIKQAGNSLLSIINDILDFSKIESGKLEIVPVNYSFSSMLQDVISIIRMRAAKKGLLFTVNVDSALPDELIGDTVRVRQTMINILDNAVKYTREGFVALRIACAPEGEDQVRLFISVEDSGSGIKEEDFPLLFQDFVQLNTKKNIGIVGTGLGLTISKNLMQAMGGDIKVKSEYGKGSVFTIELPQKKRSAKRVAEVIRPEEKAVLLYCKDPRVTGSIGFNCGVLGVSCDVAGTGDEFRQRLGSSAYTHAIVMPDVYEEAARLLEAGGGGIKTVLLVEADARPSAQGVHTLALPAHAVSLANLLNEAPQTTEEAPQRHSFSAPEARILIVDDNRTNLRVAVGLLQPYKIQVDTCDSGARACELVAENSYEIVFMDHMMPEMDGIETTQRIRQMPGTENLPIIALTANAVSGMREMFIQKGMNGFLSKPIDVAKLHQELDAWIPEEKKLSAQPGNEHIGQSLPEIDGVDAVSGLQRVGGSLEQYFDILLSYCDEADKLAEAIRAALSENDYNRFTIYAHSLKSSSASIGAAHVSQEAAQLEQAGNARNEAAIQGGAEKFLKELAGQVAAIRAVLSQRHDDRTQGDKARLRQEIPALLEALENFDLSAASKILDELEGYQWPEEIGEALAQVAEDVLLSEVEDATARLEKLLD